MWTLFLALSLIAGLASLGWSLWSSLKGWEGIGQFAVFLAGWLPATSILSIFILAAAAAKAGWRWTFVAGILVLLGSLQFSLLVLLADHRWPYCFMPLVLVCLSSIAMVRRNYPIPLPAPIWMQHGAPWFVVLGLLAIGGAFVLRARDRRQLDERLELLRLENAHKDATSRGLARAAWLLGYEFSYQDDYSEADFVRSRVYRAPRSGGEYRWDDDHQRLVVMRSLFGELSAVRPRVLPVAARAIESRALRPGTRRDLGGGVLQCAPPLECRIVWEFDVEPLHPEARALRAAVDAWVAALEISVDKELFPAR